MAKTDIRVIHYQIVDNDSFLRTSTGYDAEQETFHWKLIAAIHFHCFKGIIIVVEILGCGDDLIADDSFQQFTNFLQLNVSFYSVPLIISSVIYKYSCPSCGDMNESDHMSHEN